MSQTHYLITGGAGFIGSNFIRSLLEREADCRVTNLDKLTYAGNLANLEGVVGDPRYSFVKGDICDGPMVESLIESTTIVVNFAAETHVDRSILEPLSFIRTDVLGVGVLLEAFRKRGGRLFLHISTDEVYGSIAQGRFREEDALNPSSPYSASKAGGDRLAYSYFVTYGVPVIIARPSNAFGPYQYPEKVIPLFTTNALDDVPLPLYGDGRNVRDWLFVGDLCRGLGTLIEKGQPGKAYNLGGGNELENRELSHRILRLLGKPESLIRPVADRLGHDRRYALDSSRAASLGWSPSTPFDSALRETVEWYAQHRAWWEAIKQKSEDYRRHHVAQYGAPPGQA
ncbi:MAG: dTDP-glucose 4,6-dehydratase [Acidobacteriota bacterium]